MTDDKKRAKLLKEIEGLKFEKAIERLESIVERLESEEVDLAGSLELYDEATLIGGHCQKLLDDAESRVKEVGDSGELTDFE